MPVGLDDHVSVNKDVVFRNVDGEMVLLDLERGVYFGLDPVGTRVWEALVEHGRARPVIAALCEEFDVSPDVLASDVAGLLNELLDRDLIRVEP